MKLCIIAQLKREDIIKDKKRRLQKYNIKDSIKIIENLKNYIISKTAIIRINHLSILSYSQIRNV